MPIRKTNNAPQLCIRKPTQAKEKLSGESPQSRRQQSRKVIPMATLNLQPEDTSGVRPPYLPFRAQRHLTQERGFGASEMPTAPKTPSRHFRPQPAPSRINKTIRKFERFSPQNSETSLPLHTASTVSAASPSLTLFSHDRTLEQPRARARGLAIRLPSLVAEQHMALAQNPRHSKHPLLQREPTCRPNYSQQARSLHQTDEKLCFVPNSRPTSSISASGHEFYCAA